jgi:hypothetical protein
MQKQWKLITWRPNTREAVAVLAQLAACSLCVIVKPGTLTSIFVSILWGVTLAALIIACFRRRWLKFYIAISAVVAYRSVLDAVLAWSCAVGGSVRACP